MFFPIAKDLTDEELLNKITEIRKKKILLAGFSKSTQALEQINLMESELLSAYNERSFLRVWEENKENLTKPIETDPSLAKEEVKEKGRKSSKETTEKNFKKPWQRKSF
jgi:hypothetical protein